MRTCESDEELRRCFMKIFTFCWANSWSGRPYLTIYRFMCRGFGLGDIAHFDTSSLELFPFLQSNHGRPA